MFLHIFSTKDKSYGNDQGYQNFTFTASTLADSCFTGISIDTITHIVGFECKSADVSVTLNSPSIDDVSILSIIGTFQQVLTDSNGEATCTSPALSTSKPLGTSPAPDWFVDTTSYTTNFTLNNLTPDGCYCVQFFVQDGVGNVYDEISSIVCINDDKCISNPGPVQDIEATCDKVCFTPAVFIDEEGVEREATAYRLEITDQEGNVDFVFKTDFSDSCDGIANPEGKLCFCISEVQSIIDDIGRAPYVGHIRTHYQEQDEDGVDIGAESTTNSNLFTVEDCCTEIEFEDPDIIHSFNSCARYQFVYFCLEDLPGCVLSNNGVLDIFDISVQSDFPAEWIIDEGLEESCITLKFFTDVLDSCQPIDYSTTIFYRNIYGDIMTHTIVGEIPYCCDVTPPNNPNPGPEGPTPITPIFFKSIYPDDEGQSISIRAEIEESIEEKVQESRQRYVPVFYTLIDKQTNEFLKINQYSTELYLNFPERQYDKEIFNQKYGLYMLANNKVFTLEFPEYNYTEARNSTISQKNISDKLKIYPNPSNNHVAITLDGNLIYNVKVYDQNGILHKVLQADSNEIKVSLDDLAEGMYYLHIEDVSGNRYIEKVVFMK